MTLKSHVGAMMACFFGYAGDLHETVRSISEIASVDSPSCISYGLCNNSSRER